MAVRGPLREIEDATPIETDGRGNREVQLKLACGHTVFRKLRRRHRTNDKGSARCGRCRKERE